MLSEGKHLFFPTVDVFFFNLSIPLHGHSFVFITEPPPKCTLEDRSLDHEEPMPGDLDLDDPCSLPPTERPPSLPLPLIMTNKTKPNNHHGDPRKFLFCFIFSTSFAARSPRLLFLIQNCLQAGDFFSVSLDLFTSGENSEAAQTLN